MTRTPVLWIALACASALVLAGCSAGDAADGEPLDPSDGSTESSSGDGPADCLIGTWNLDLPLYATNAEAYFVGLGVPFTEFSMDGFQTLEFADDGLLSLDTDLISYATMTAGETVVPISTRVAERATAEWGTDGDAPADAPTITLGSFEIIESEGTTGDTSTADFEVPGPGLLEGTQLLIDCSADTLVLLGDGPIAASWVRG